MGVRLDTLVLGVRIRSSCGSGHWVKGARWSDGKMDDWSLGGDGALRGDAEDWLLMLFPEGELYGNGMDGINKFRTG